MANISDFKIGTTYLEFIRADFKDPKRFDEYCKFLMLPETTGFIIDISPEQHRQLIFRANEDPMR